jgi:hypothetical protein
VCHGVDFDNHNTDDAPTMKRQNANTTDIFSRLDLAKKKAITKKNIIKNRVVGRIKSENNKIGIAI